jgi:hypothetical protein
MADKKKMITFSRPVWWDSEGLLFRIVRFGGNKYARN